MRKDPHVLVVFVAIHREGKKQGAGFHLRSSACRLLELFSELGAHFELEDIHL